ncbi:hypothetical protein Hypma_015809 [Hypsizygus marmoreus]|uniref:N-acetyltransferase domain-containing protein n=1 Tax=Hypsizygus marmoreus TaxID=39966 RepID=A0A369KA06_HYPMA|nr:hypothetical protein Hypma_015809 [Hypsizygus marmoreus]
MPAVSTTFSASVYRSAKSLPHVVWSTFESDPRNSNVMYAHAFKAAQEIMHTSVADGHLWIVCSTEGDLQTPVDLVLSCTQGPLGTYPIFIFCAHPLSKLTDQFLVPRMHLLVKTLHGCVKTERVYSVFAVDVVTRIFAEHWYHLTGVQHYREPYYAAKITFCTTRTLKVRRQFTVLPDISYDLRLAVTDDIPDVSKLCYGFAAASEPFVLTMEKAIQEATLLVENKQIWVHTVNALNQRPEIASIVAVTREGGAVAAITKVYTNPDWRSRRCAERLVRKVTQTLLKSKESVILYVAHNNPAACKVYNRVGFVGLDGSLPPVNGVDSWLELGFDRDLVDLGHW